MNVISYLEKNVKLIPHLNSPSKSELFISTELANKILNRFPEDDWANPNLKFLEIASNNGIVSIMIALRLFNNEKMKLWQPDDELRLNHILKNQVYAFTYTSSGANITKKGLYNTTNIDLNVKVVDLNKIDSANSSIKYDRIVCVPPRGTRKRFWPVYTEYTMNLCVDDGHTIHLINPNWRLKPDVKMKIKRTGNNMFTFLRNYNISNVEMDGWVDFGLRHDIVHVIKSNPTNRTLVKDCKLTEGYYDLTNMFILPNFDIDKINSLFTHNINNRITIYASDDCDPRRNYMSVSKTKTHIYPCINSISKNDVGYCYSSDADKGNRYDKKVIISNGQKVWDVINDIKGEYAITNHAYGIGIDADTDISLLTSALNSDKFNEFLRAIKWEPREIEDYTLKLLNKNFYKML
jgi:hypothetical protein